jgi:hypothetical protein
MTCIACGSLDISSDLSKHFEHEGHLMCPECIRCIVLICTCEKKLNEMPSKCVSICPCSEHQNRYFDIPLKDIDQLLSKRADDVYMIECCKGCSLDPAKIETDIVVGMHSSMDACIFAKVPDTENTFSYIADAINQDFVEAVKNYNVELFKELGFDNFLDV